MAMMQDSSRRDFLLRAFSACSIGTLAACIKEAQEMPATSRMPVVFVGHGTPRSAVWTNEWTASWEKLGTELPRPSTILSISAHWLTRGGAFVTASREPRMNYDFYGFPDEMYKVVYPAPGNIDLAQQIQSNLGAQLPVRGDTEWGFDHGTWVVLKYMFPKADIPVIQLSIDYSKPPVFHYELGKQLAFLRTRGVLILGSGNLVHNLNMRPGMNGDKPYDWATEFDARIWKNIEDSNHQAVIDFQKMGSVAVQAHPTYDHFLPLLYCLGLKTDQDGIRTFNDNFQWPAVSMRSIVIA
jgi:4,5-DOPA dioxygenase extradiol